MPIRTHSAAVVLLVGAVPFVLTACGGSAGQRADQPAPVLLTDAEADEEARIRAAESLWSERSPQDDSVHEALWATMQRRSDPPRLRARVVELLATDADPQTLSASRRKMLLLLPTETAWPVIEAICAAAAQGGAGGQGGWSELTGSIVRSYARPVPVPADDQRPERIALQRLHPDQSVVETVFRVFTTPMEERNLPDMLAERERDDAWALLARLDGDGSQRAAFLNASGAELPDPDGSIADLRAYASDLGVTPVTASELRWARQLRDDSHSGWWDAARGAVAALGPAQREGLQLRHIEPLLYAAQRRSEWVSMDRSGLLRTLAERLDGRRTIARDAMRGPGARGERLRDWDGDLVWGDLLTILVLDEAIRDPQLTGALFEQSLKDHADGSTEHGGVLAWQEPSSLSVRAYEPRVSQRVNDRTFVAPQSMFDESATSLAHYHFHAHDTRNADYAGPGPADLVYAREHGRNCLVLTTIGRGRLNVDYYQRNGATIDLGVLDAE